LACGRYKHTDSVVGSLVVTYFCPLSLILSTIPSVYRLPSAIDFRINVSVLLLDGSRDLLIALKPLVDRGRILNDERRRTIGSQVFKADYYSREW